MSNTVFGFKKVAENIKSTLVNNVFTSVAGKYDVMNDVMSLGVHRFWKDQLVKHALLKDDLKVLDMAGGTGDIAFRLHKKLHNFYDNFNITIADYNQGMLEVGKNRAIDKNIIDDSLLWQQENGEKISFKDNEFDLYTIAYGIRNFTDIEKGLQEAYRVLQPGGQFLCLEFSAVENDFLKKFYDFYSFKIIPKVGEIITQDRESYQYFVESIRTFPKPEEFVQMIGDVGFKKVKHINLTGGITTLYVAFKP